jgi:hypothetical protein
MACSKQAYPNVDAAGRALRKLAKKGRSERRAYECRRCGKWHLTSKSARSVWIDEAA